MLLQHYSYEKPPRKSKITDILWVPIFAAVVVGYIVITAIDMNDGVRQNIFTFKQAFNKHYMVALAASLGSGLGFSLIYTVIVHRLAKLFIVIAMLLHTIILFALTIYYGVQHDCINAFGCGLSALAGIVIFPLFYSKIRQASKQWNKAVKVACQFPTVILCGTVLTVVATGLAVLTGLVIFAEYHTRRSLDECLALVLIVALGGYIQIAFAKVVVRSSVACVYGYWYFTDTGPSVPILSGLKQSLTFSLGSLCAACLVLSFVNVAAYIFPLTVDLLRIAEADVVAVCSTANTLVSIFDWMFQIVSLYTTIYVVVYNKSYLAATQQALAYLATHMVGEALTGGIFLVICRSVGTISRFICYVYLHENHLEQRLLCAFVELAATQLCSVMLSPIVIGVQTLGVLEAGTVSDAA